MDTDTAFEIGLDVMHARKQHDTLTMIEARRVLHNDGWHNLAGILSAAIG